MHSFRIAAIVLSKKAFLIQIEKSEQEDKRHHKSVHYTNTWKQDIQLVVVLIYYKLYRSKLTVKTSCFGISSNHFMKKKLFGAKILTWGVSTENRSAQQQPPILMKSQLMQLVNNPHSKVVLIFKDLKENGCFFLIKILLRCLFWDCNNTEGGYIHNAWR